MMTVRRRGFVAFLLLASLYYLFSIGLYVAESTGGLALDIEPSPVVRSFLAYSEFQIGAIGLIGIVGLALTRRWGFWITMAVSAYTIAFDGWSAVAVQASAAAGIIPPILFIGYLYADRVFLHRSPQVV